MDKKDIYELARRVAQAAASFALGGNPTPDEINVEFIGDEVIELRITRSMSVDEQDLVKELVRAVLPEPFRDQRPRRVTFC